MNQNIPLIAGLVSGSIPVLYGAFRKKKNKKDWIRDIGLGLVGGAALGGLTYLGAKKLQDKMIESSNTEDLRKSIEKMNENRSKQGLSQVLLHNGKTELQDLIDRNKYDPKLSPKIKVVGGLDNEQNAIIDEAEFLKSKYGSEDKAKKMVTDAIIARKNMGIGLMGEFKDLSNDDIGKLALGDSIKALKGMPVIQRKIDSDSTKKAIDEFRNKYYKDGVFDAGKFVVAAKDKRGTLFDSVNATIGYSGTYSKIPFGPNNLKKDEALWFENPNALIEQKMTHEVTHDLNRRVLSDNSRDPNLAKIGNYGTSNTAELSRVLSFLKGADVKSGGSGNLKDFKDFVRVAQKVDQRQDLGISDVEVKRAARSILKASKSEDKGALKKLEEEIKIIAPQVVKNAPVSQFDMFKNYV